jgi:protein TonB
MNAALPSATLLTPSALRAGWAPQRPHRAPALLVLVVHAVALLALVQAGRQVIARAEPASVSVSLLPEAAPARATPEPPTPRVPPVLVPTVPVPVVPVPEFSPSAAQREVAPPPPPLPATAPTPSPEPSVARVTPPAPAPGPKPVAAGALRYRVEPAVEVPRLSRRAGESGRVQLRVVFDTEGRPRDIQLARSSGFARLDAQAREAMQAARIVPFVEDGRAIEVVALATLEYELN